MLVAGFAMTACTERIDVELDDTYTRLVVDGQLLTDAESKQYVLLSETSSYFYNQPPPPVTGADVTISDEDGNSTFLSEESPGVYMMPEGFSSEIGTKYGIDIKLTEEIDGHLNYSAETSTPIIGDTVWIELKHEPDWGDKGYYIVECYYYDPLGPNWYMFYI